MDWNNINTDRDTSGLGPIEYDQTKVPALIHQYADYVRTKTYGQEVREAQARNAEYAGLIAGEAETKATSADLLSKDTQNRFNDQIAGNTNIDEVIDGRRAYGATYVYKTLSERLESLRVVVNIRDFGAVGDGITDDTLAIQEAIDYVKTIGVGTLVFPDNDYNITQISLINAENIVIVSNGGTIKQTTPQLNGAIYINGSSNIMIKGLILKGNGIADTGTSGYNNHGIYVINSSNITIKENDIANMSSGGILINSSDDVRITDNNLYGNMGMFDIAYGYAEPVKPLSNAWIVNNNCTSQNRYGVFVQGYGKNVVVTGNTVKDKYEYGILVYRKDAVDVGGEVWENIIVTGNVIENVSNNTIDVLSYKNGMGIYLQTAEKVTCSNNVVRNVLQNRTEIPTYRTLLPAAISIGGTREISCVGNVIDGSGVDGIGISNVEFASKGSIVANNVLTGITKRGINLNGAQNVIVSANTLEGVYADDSLGIISSSVGNLNNEKITLKGNVIVSGFKTGISVIGIDNTNSRDIIVTDNTISGCLYNFLTSDMVDGFIAKGNMIIADNTNQNSGNYAILINKCFNFSVSNNIAKGDNTYSLNKGIGVKTSEFGHVSSNIVRDVTDIANSLEKINCVNVYNYFNQTDRMKVPRLDTYAFGSDVSSGSRNIVTYLSAPPVSDTYSVGSIVYNTNPTAGGYIGWVCMAAGTPGIWKGFGAIEQ